MKIDQGEMYVQFDFDAKALTSEMESGIIDAMEASVGNVERRAKGLVPVGGRDIRINARARVSITSRRGRTRTRIKIYKSRNQYHLRNSISSGVRDKGSGPIGFVNANERHSKVVEYGGVVGRSDPYPGKHPDREHRRYVANPYLIPAFEAEKAAFEKRVSDVMDKALEAASDSDMI